MVNRAKAGVVQNSGELTYSNIVQMLKAAHNRRTMNTRWLDATNWCDHLSLKQWEGMEAVPRHANRALRRRISPGLSSTEYEILSKRGQKAIDELRHVMPRYIQLRKENMENGQHSLLYLISELPDEQTFAKKWISDQIWLTQVYTAMLGGLINFDSKELRHQMGQGRREAKSWHWDALLLFSDFVKIMGAGSISQNGPAVHFTQAVLAWAGIAVDGRAIEQALRRGGAQVIARKDVSKTAKGGRPGKQ